MNDLTEGRKALAREEEVLSTGTRIPFYPLAIKEAEGDIIKDYDGNEFIDFLSSACVANTGHGHPLIKQSMMEQMNELIHYNPAYGHHKYLVTLAEELCRITPGIFPKRVSFGLSGGDANDTAIKLARSYTRRQKIISFSRSYHGTTYGALSLSAVSLAMRKHLGPFLPEIYHVPFPDVYRSSFDEEGETERCIQAIRELFETVAPPEEVAALFIEPIQGDSGILVPPIQYIDEVKKICAEHDILLVADEVQSGFGRTGAWFASEHFGLEPDLIVLGKSIASGMPLSAVVGRSEILKSWEAPAGAFSMAANPISCAASIATIQIIEDEKLTARSYELGQMVVERFREMKDRFHLIGDIRGKGLMLGVDIVGDRDSKQRDSSRAAKICWRCWKKGLFMTFFSQSVLRIAPPLTISYEHLKQGLNIIEEALLDVEQGKVPDSVLRHIKGW